MAIDYSKYIESTGTHYISNSGKDENSAYRGGQAGDQSGHEWELKKWYSRPWTVVLRYPDIKIGLRIAKLGIAAALNDKIGYDQNQRTTYWTQLEKAGYDPSKITVACEEDCTAGVTANVKAAGYLYGIKELQSLPTSVYSGNMKSTFVKAGFSALTSSKFTDSPDYLLPGDILLYENHHAATNISYGSKVKKEEVTQTELIETSDDPEPISSYISVTNGKYHVRVLPNTKAKSLGVANKDDKLIYLDETENGWWKVQFGGGSGWISGKCGSLVEVEPIQEEIPSVPEYDEEYPSDDLEPTETTGKVDVIEPIKSLRVKSVFTRMRSAPDTSFQKIATLYRGYVVQYLGEEMDGWLFVRYKDLEGWVKVKTVEEVDE